MTVQQFFDDHGRCLPTNLRSKAHEITRRYFLCEQPEIDYDDIYGRLASTLIVEEGFTVKDFLTRAESLSP